MPTSYAPNSAGKVLELEFGLKNAAAARAARSGRDAPAAQIGAEAATRAR